MQREQLHGLDIRLLERNEFCEPRRDVVDIHVVERSANGDGLHAARGCGRKGLRPSRAPRDPTHGVRILRRDEPRRKELLARQPLDKRNMPRIASGRRLQEFVDARCAKHRASDLLARRRKTRNRRHRLAAPAERVKFAAQSVCVRGAGLDLAREPPYFVRLRFARGERLAVHGLKRIGEIAVSRREQFVR